MTVSYSIEILFLPSSKFQANFEEDRHNSAGIEIQAEVS
jgi:hypothetical protein